MNRYQMQFMSPVLTPVVKWLIIANVAVWFFGVLIVQQFLMHGNYLFAWFGFVPARVFYDFWIWQFFTYMFLHATSVFHILFNMLFLWWFGGELEEKWGGRFFLTYYFVSGIGAGVIYLIGTLVYFVVTGQYAPLTIPVVGASGAIFGVLTAYGLIFGERVGYFFFLFPMKMKYMIMIIIGVELAYLLGSRLSGDVANLAHIGGVISGFLFLYLYGKYQRRRSRKVTVRRGRKLKLVVNNNNQHDKDDTSGPRYWN